MDANFISDNEKMNDFVRLQRYDFLKSYSYLTESEYNNTLAIWNNGLKELWEYITNYYPYAVIEYIYTPSPKYSGEIQFYQSKKLMDDEHLYSCYKKNNTIQIDTDF